MKQAQKEKFITEVKTWGYVPEKFAEHLIKACAAGDDKDKLKLAFQHVSKEYVFPIWNELCRQTKDGTKYEKSIFRNYSFILEVMEKHSLEENLNGLENLHNTFPTHPIGNAANHIWYGLNIKIEEKRKAKDTKNAAKQEDENKKTSDVQPPETRNQETQLSSSLYFQTGKNDQATQLSSSASLRGLRGPTGNLNDLVPVDQNKPSSAKTDASTIPPIPNSSSEPDLTSTSTSTTQVTTATFQVSSGFWMKIMSQPLPPLAMLVLFLAGVAAIGLCVVGALAGWAVAPVVGLAVGGAACLGASAYIGYRFFSESQDIKEEAIFVPTNTLIA